MTSSEEKTRMVAVDVSIAETAAVVLIEKFKEQDKRIQLLEQQVAQLRKVLERVEQL